MGRDQRTRQQFQADAGTGAVRDVLAASRQKLMDRFGRPLLEGGAYLFHTTHPHVFTVQSIAPTLIPDMPPGMYKVTVTCTVDLILQGGRLTEELTLVTLPQPAPGASPTEIEPELPMEPGAVTRPADGAAAEEPPHGQN